MDRKIESSTSEVKQKALPKRMNLFFSTLIGSYIMVGCAACLYLLLSASMMNIELSKLIQYPIATPMLVYSCVSFFMIYVCIMIKEHMHINRVLYKEDIYLLRGMIVVQALSFNYISLLPTILIYIGLRKNNFCVKMKYPDKDAQNRFIPIMRERMFYNISFTIIGLTFIFTVLLLFAFIHKG